ncbi:response regulator transcription factor [Terrabacter sp. NPDC080008]|uniref:response regulator transcription factor n=1 Tax=Terrabacter sp. NPDC080008 TaxID=3155176 RepID=UPI00344EE3AB
MTPQPVRVVVFARQQLLLEALAETLGALPGLRVVGRADTADGLLQAVAAGSVDVLVLHAVSRQDAVLELARSALQQAPDVGVVLVTQPEAGDMSRDALEMGIHGWVRSDEPFARLVTAVRRVAAHEVFIPVALMASLLGPPPAHGSPGSAGALLEMLTPRQADVLRCLMDGHSRAETAHLLGMSPNTVRTHVGAILRRLQVHTTLAAVVEARRNGLLGRSAEEASTAKGVDGLGR